MIGEFFGATHDFEYNIGDKLYEQLYDSNSFIW